MWQDKNPFIINWEASGYINPTTEVISTAYYWAGGETEKLNFSKIEIFLQSYRECSKIKMDRKIEVLVYADFYSELNWLEYNLKRSMCIENQYDNEEIQLAANEVLKEIKDIKYKISQ